jgi:hypothetical protein
MVVSLDLLLLHLPFSFFCLLSSIPFQPFFPYLIFGNNINGFVGVCSKFDDEKVSIVHKDKILGLDGGGEDSIAYILLYRPTKI